MGNLEKVLIVIILATVAVITALAFLDSGEIRVNEPRAVEHRAEIETGEPAETPVARNGFGPIRRDPADRDPERQGKSNETMMRALSTTLPAPESIEPGPSEGEATRPETPARDLPAPSRIGSPFQTESDPGRNRRTFFPARRYRVLDGDTYSDIAEELYGDRRYATAIREANTDVLGNEPPPGSVLFIPPSDSVPEPPAPGSQGDHPETVWHTVKKGETLSGISRHYYKAASRWGEILKANPEIIKDERDLRPGMVLAIPGIRH